MSELKALLELRNLDCSEAARRDLESGLVDIHLVKILSRLTKSYRLRIETIKTGHPMGATSPAGRRNAHYFYQAADIYAVDEQLVADRPISVAVVELGQLLMALPAELRASKIMGPAVWHDALGNGDRTGFRNDDFANLVHVDHLHLEVADSSL